MKRIVVLMLSGMLAISLVGCSKGETNNEANKETASSDIVNTDSAQEEGTLQDKNSQIAEEEVPVADPSVDIDLTSMSSTFIYSEVYNMMMEPLAYVGKTVKMEGSCGMYVDEQTGKTYYACIVQDATQCCSQGLEFVLDEDKYSETDYPKEGDEITVKGEFSTYEENGGTYLTMKKAVME